MTKIHIVESFDHGEVVNSLCHLLPEKYSLKVYGPESIKKYICKPPQNTTFQFFNNRFQFLMKLIFGWKEISTCDFLIFTTIPVFSRLICHRVLPSVTILIVHNGNAVFARNIHYRSPQNLQEIFLSMGRFIQRKILMKNLCTKKILGKVRALSFSDELIHNHFLGIGSIPFREKIIKPLPINFFYLPSKPDTGNKINILIPGSVNRSNRDYQILFKSLENLQLTNEQLSVKLILAGQLTDKKLIGELDSFNDRSKVVSIVYHTKKLDQTTYDSLLKKAHFGVLNVKNKVLVGGISEYYGSTKISGSVNDFIRFGIPFLRPEGYQTDHLTDKLSEPFSNQESLSKSIENWINNSVYMVKRTKAEADLKKHSLEVRKKQMELVLNDLTGQDN